MLRVRSFCENLPTNADSFSIFNSLRKVYTDDQLFLLESLSGPNKDMNQALIGIEPLFNIKMSLTAIKISGVSAIVSSVSTVLDSIDELSKVKECEYKIKNLNKIWEILRKIESVFALDYLGDRTSLAFGYFGYFGYDSVRVIENLPYCIHEKNQKHIIDLSIYSTLISMDLKNGQNFLITNELEHAPKSPVKKVIMSIVSEKKYDETQLDICPDNKVSVAKRISDSVDKKTYFNWVHKALDHIVQGDIYQIQLGHEITIDSEIKPYSVYKRLRKINPSPYMYYTQLGDMHIIGASPELFLRIDKNNKLTMRPIAGTIRAGKNAEEDKLLQHAMLNDEKERAEHIMLVDLCRNDIGRVCTKRTLETDELMVVEKYSHVSHIVSNVIGQKEASYDKYDVIAATFPAGTMTGAPKVRAMEIIEETENSRRGLYAGCIGFIDFSGVVETALCIRTATYQSGIYTIRASGGIVYDSTPEGEWKETISKLSSTYYAITAKELRNEDFIN